MHVQCRCDVSGDVTWHCVLSWNCSVKMKVGIILYQFCLWMYQKYLFTKDNYSEQAKCFMVLRTLQILVKNSTSYCVNISLPPEYSNLMFTFFFIILPAISTICCISWVYSFCIRIHPRKYISALRRISLVVRAIITWLFVVGSTLLVANIRSSDGISFFWV